MGNLCRTNLFYCLDLNFPGLILTALVVHRFTFYREMEDLTEELSL